MKTEKNNKNEKNEKNEIDLVLEKYGYKFEKVFDTKLEYFVHPLFKLLGIYSFDVIGFDRWLHKQGYREEEHGSMKDYVTLKYGEENEKFLEEVMNFRMRKSSRKKEEFLEEFIGYLQSEPADFQEFVGRLLASLPGGDKGNYEPFTFVGWFEKELIIDLLKNIENVEDVRRAIKYLNIQ